MLFVFLLNLLLAHSWVDHAYAEIHRKYPQGGGCDTMLMAADGKIRGVHQSEIPLFRDEEIIKVFPSSAPNLIISDGPFHIESEIPAPGKHLIQQLGFRGCTAAVTAMLIVDHGKKPNLNELYDRNLGDERDMMRDLKEAGLRPLLKVIGLKDAMEGSYLEFFAGRGLSPVIMKVPSEDEVINTLAHEIEVDGPAILSIEGEIRGHVIVVDQIDLPLQQATIRDPYHGWMITISLSSLKRRARPVHYEIIQAGH